MLDPPLRILRVSLHLRIRSFNSYDHLQILFTTIIIPKESNFAKLRLGLNHLQKS